MMVRFRLRLFIRKNAIESLVGFFDEQRRIYFSYYDIARILKEDDLKNCAKFIVNFENEHLFFFHKYPFYVISEQDFVSIVRRRLLYSKAPLEARYLFDIFHGNIYVEEEKSYYNEFVLTASSHAKYCGMQFRTWIKNIKQH